MPRSLREIVVAIRSDASCVRKQKIDNLEGLKPLPSRKKTPSLGLLREVVVDIMPVLAPEVVYKKEPKALTVERDQQRLQGMKRKIVKRQSAKTKPSKLLKTTIKRHSTTSFRGPDISL